MTILETNNYASGIKMSFGRNQDKNSKQGYILWRVSKQF